MINPKNRQEANSLLALRLDTKREILEELYELNNEIKVLEKYIEMCNNTDNK